MMITKDSILRKAGFGDTTDSALLMAAQSVSTPCTADMSTGGNQSVQSFQQAWNATTDGSYGSPALTTDGKYGPQTAAAYASFAAGNGLTTYPVCPQFAGGGGGAAPGSTVVNVPPTTITPTPKTNWTPWIIGGAVLIGGATIYGLARYKKKRGHLPGISR